MRHAYTVSASRFLSRERFPWIVALGLSFVLCVLASFRGGYVGPDYPVHLERLTHWSAIFDFSTTSPPTYYILGYAVYSLLGPNIAFPIALSILQAAMNTVALWWFFVYSERRFVSPAVHLALVLFLSFLPVRMTHSTVLGTDCATIPIFVLILFTFDRLLSEEGSRLKSAGFLGASLLLGVCTKYSFMALLPVIPVIFAGLAWRQYWGFRRFVTVSFVTVFAASLFSFASFWLSSRVHGYNTDKHWLPKGAANDMGFKELFSIKRADAALFQAPEYFKKEILAAHKHSYLGLCHLGVFTDTMNLFQNLKVPHRYGLLIPDQKTRLPWKTPLMVASMSLGIIWTLSVLVGVPWALFCALQNLAKGWLEREDAAALMGTALFLLIFLSIPYVYAGAQFGYWTPRLILPSILSFSFVAFLFLERKIVRGSDRTASAVLLLAAVQSAIEIVMLA